MFAAHVHTHPYTHLCIPAPSSGAKSIHFCPGLADHTLLCTHIPQSQKEANVEGSWDFLLLALHSRCLSLPLWGWPRSEPQPPRLPEGMDSHLGISEKDTVC